MCAVNKKAFMPSLNAIKDKYTMSCFAAEGIGVMRVARLRSQIRRGR